MWWSGPAVSLVLPSPTVQASCGDAMMVSNVSRLVVVHIIVLSSTNYAHRAIIP